MRELLETVAKWAAPVVAAIVIAGGSAIVTYWVNFRPTSASVSIRPSSIDLLNNPYWELESSSNDKQRFFSSIGSLVVEKSGEEAAGLCYLQMRSDRGIVEEQLTLLSDVTVEGDVEGQSLTSSIELGANEFQRKLLFKVPAIGGPPFVGFENVAFQLSCERAVSQWENFPLADRRCRTDQFRLECISGGWTP